MPPLRALNHVLTATRYPQNPTMPSTLTPPSLQNASAPTAATDAGQRAEAVCWLRWPVCLRRGALFPGGVAVAEPAWRGGG